MTRPVGGSKCINNLLACADRDDLPEAPPNYPPMAAWPNLRGTDKILSAWERSLRLDGGQEPVVYVHVPFCETLCSFCGFYKISGTPARIDRYLDALEREAAMMGPLFSGRGLRFLCVGGGTPSMLSLAQLERLFRILKSNFKITPRTRIAFESSPNTLDPVKLSLLKAAGVEWLAIGVQSFDRRLLSGMNRRQDPERVMEVVKQAKRAGIRQVEVDLIAGLPGQTEETLLRDVRTAAALDLERIYIFDFQPKCYTAAGAKAGSLSGRRMESARGWRRKAMDILLEQGYKMRCGHWVYKRKGNLRPYSYDQGEDGSYSILGLGPSAVSYAMNAARYRNSADEAGYERKLGAGRLPLASGCLLSQRDEMVNFILLETLHRGQLEKRKFRRRFGADLEKTFSRELDCLVEAGVLEEGGEALLVTDRSRASTELRRVLYSREVVSSLERVYGPAEDMPSDGAPAQACAAFHGAARGVCELHLAGGPERLLYGSGGEARARTTREMLTVLFGASRAGLAEVLLVSGRSAGGVGPEELAAVRCASAAGFKKISVLSKAPGDPGFLRAWKSAGASDFLLHFDGGAEGTAESAGAAAAAGLRVTAVHGICGGSPRPVLAAARLRAAGVGGLILAFPEGAENIRTDYASLRPLVKAAAASRLPVTFLRVPLCALYPHWRLSGDYLRGTEGDARESGCSSAGAKPRLCLRCRFLLKCPGPARGYFAKFGTKGLRCLV